MIFRILRKLVLLGAVWLLGPMGFAFGHSALLPDRVGSVASIGPAMYGHVANRGGDVT
jgi:hypothetical protein